ncbi:uncharacterized protein FIBRA_08325 [Fibroporia radiculosa]|uniref:Uridylate kinase n=1 Tax=Fibroporia radiculosa TaxID=599839 RepID=J4GH40_9APHY|nr:uncharacterized protein FIBRA_08325 [Fibroporia radiculosa]CCM06078.1 predicted protein [Fibroporia radiculosa]
MPNKAPNPLYFLGLSLASFGAFYWLAKRREATYPASKQPRQNRLTAWHRCMPAIFDKIASALHIRKKQKRSAKPRMSAFTTPAFDNSKVTVIFVLGGPGAGKGTQCANLVQDFDFCHLSAGDLLRAEQNREGSQYGEMIRTFIREGQIVPMEVTIKLLENAMRAALTEGRADEGWTDSRGRFLIDGFPRKMDQAMKFDEEVCQSSLVMFFTTTEEEMLKRLMERGKTSGREDDNEESIKKRFRVYKEQTMPVIEYYNNAHKVATIDATATIEEVHEKAKSVVTQLFKGEITRNFSSISCSVTLSLDVLGLILSRLDTKSALTFSRTSKLFHTVATRQAVSSLTLDFARDSYKFKQKRLKAVFDYLLADIPGRLHYVHHLKIVRSCFWDGPFLDTGLVPVLANILENAQNLQTLYLEAMQPLAQRAPAIVNAIVGLPRLEKLKLTEVDSPTPKLLRGLHTTSVRLELEVYQNSTHFRFAELALLQGHNITDLTFSGPGPWGFYHAKLLQEQHIRFPSVRRFRACFVKGDVDTQGSRIIHILKPVFPNLEIFESQIEAGGVWRLHMCSTCCT